MAGYGNEIDHGSLHDVAGDYGYCIGAVRLGAVLGIADGVVALRPFACFGPRGQRAANSALSSEYDGPSDGADRPSCKKTFARCCRWP